MDGLGLYFSQPCLGRCLLQGSMRVALEGALAATCPPSKPVMGFGNGGVGGERMSPAALAAAAPHVGHAA